MELGQVSVDDNESMVVCLFVCLIGVLGSDFGSALAMHQRLPSCSYGGMLVDFEVGFVRGDEFHYLDGWMGGWV